MTQNAHKTNDMTEVAAAKDVLDSWERDGYTQLPSPVQLYRLARVLPDNDDSLFSLATILPFRHVRAVGKLFLAAAANNCSNDDAVIASRVIRWIGYHPVSALEDEGGDEGEPDDDSLALLPPVVQASLISVTKKWEDLLPLILSIHEHSWVDFCSYQNRTDPSWRESLLAQFPEHQAYLSSLLSSDPMLSADETAAVQQNLKQAVQSVKTKVGSRAPVKSAQKLGWQARIDQVRTILPDAGYGEGFIDMVLSYYKGNVDSTVATLLDGNLPPALAHVDHSLPKRQKGPTPTSLDSDNENIKAEANRATLQRVQEQQEQEAYLIDRVMRETAHDQYNDDYDDRYDDTEGVGTGVKDSGLYDDFEAVRVYNRVVKEVVAEQQFWQDNQNTNRQQAVAKGKKKFGPNKTKGGRIPGRGRGGRGGRGRSPANVQQEEANEVVDHDAPVRVAGKNLVARAPTAAASGRGGRGKERKMNKRRDQQKKAAAKRQG